mgnify:CR=1 FL=1|jgi:hypothetical protein
MDLRLWRVGVAERVSLPKRRVSLNYLRLWRVGAAEHVSLRKRGVLPNSQGQRPIAIPA